MRRVKRAWNNKQVNYPLLLNVPQHGRLIRNKYKRGKEKYTQGRTANQIIYQEPRGEHPLVRCTHARSFAAIPLDGCLHYNWLDSFIAICQEILLFYWQIWVVCNAHDILLPIQADVIITYNAPNLIRNDGVSRTCLLL